MYSNYQQQQQQSHYNTRRAALEGKAAKQQPNDENAVPKSNLSFSTVTKNPNAAAVPAEKQQLESHYATRAATKRSALVDVSNTFYSNANAVSNTVNVVTKSATTTKSFKTSANVSSVPPSIETGIIKTRSQIAAAAAASNVAVQKATAVVANTAQDHAAIAAAFEAKEQAKRDQLTESVPSILPWDDLDSVELDDPMSASEYVIDIFHYLKELEIKTLPDADYIILQTEMNWHMRGVLIDWIIEAHWKLKMLPETLYLAVNLIDRFLSLKKIGVRKLQLVGLTALLVASKYEELVSPSISSFVYMADNSYEDKELLKAERYMLQVLNFNMSFPNPMNFLRRISKADNYDLQNRTLAKYLLEITLMDHSCLKWVPSLLAAASVWLARKMLQKGNWNANLIHYSGYVENQIIVVANQIIGYLVACTDCKEKESIAAFEAVHKKYSSRRFMKSSVYVASWITKQQELNGCSQLCFK